MKLYKYRSDIYRDLLTLVNNQIYAPTVQHLNDPSETIVNDSKMYEVFDFIEKSGLPKNIAKDNYAKIVDQVRTKLGIFSLSKTVFNELLWAYYANGHKGFCIEYDFEQLKKSISKGHLHSIFNVQYKNDIPEFSINSITDNLVDDTQFLKCLIATKSMAWEREEEIRITLYSSGLLGISPESVTGIYFGFRMPESDKELIKASLASRDIKYYQMELKPNSYLLEAELIK
ncbi:Protein of unknown function (DUF2971) [Bacteroides salyersiae]|jgi:hypothetical protein|uniref:DUF2971 domain-containing protein n=1 Tax=Bacteroides salyersiae TaxID=291644 RepID=UPI001B8A94E3|nr:DUF2971 domain-containing protein [Bacteroides salyersiae]MCS2403838.1 DUF2971 domain-containing protein [Bacteroides salyersiae]QUT76853.1 Protein of unknown function (DUF2971) [Bacteroides salyersiae]